MRCGRMREQRRRDRSAFRKLAVGVQIALSVLLLGGAGLFVRTLDNLRQLAVGFKTANLATFTLDPTTSGYGEDRTPQIVTNSLEALRRIPGRNFGSRHHRPGALGRYRDLQLLGTGVQAH